MRWGIALVAVLAAAPAHADDVDDLVSGGEALAKSGEFSRAIALWKQADAKRPRALHACLIALSYTRRELWAQAELFAAQCHARATSVDALPPWIADLDDTIAKKRDALGVAAITFRVEPASDAAVIRLSSFEPDETFAPRTLHLSPGTYTAIVSAPGRARTTQTFEVAAGTAQTVTIALASAGVPPPRHRSRRLPWTLVAIGDVLVAGAVVIDAAVIPQTANKLKNDITTQQPAAWAKDDKSFRSQRDVAIVLGVGGAIVLATGLTLRFTLYRGHEAAVALTPRGVMLVGTM